MLGLPFCLDCSFRHHYELFLLMSRLATRLRLADGGERANLIRPKLVYRKLKNRVEVHLFIANTILE